MHLRLYKAGENIRDIFRVAGLLFLVKVGPVEIEKMFFLSKWGVCQACATTIL